MGQVTETNVGEVFLYHRLTDEQREKCCKLMNEAASFAQEILRSTPPCADQSAALRLVREAVMTANAAIALNGLI